MSVAGRLRPIQPSRAERQVALIRAWLANADARDVPPNAGLATYLELEMALRELTRYGEIRWAPDHAGALALLQDQRLPARRRRV